MDIPPAGAVWRPYGLRNNPFFTAPLASQPDVDRGIHLFRGSSRRKEAEKLVQRVLNDSNSIRLIEGPNGIGKTTLANLAKSLVSGRGDVAVYADVIQVQAGLTTPERFAAEILYATLAALKTHPAALDGAAQEARREAEGRILDQLLAPGHGQLSLSHIVGFSWTRTVVLREASERPFSDWKEALQNVSASASASGIHRLLIHINNLDQATLTDPLFVGDLFGNVRDILQLEGYHFILCASEGFRTKALSGRTNVTDLLGMPLTPSPLSPKDVEEIIEARYADARIAEHTFTPPIAAVEVARLFDLFAGDLRAVLELLGQTFMEEIGPTGEARSLSHEDVIGIQRPLVETLLGQLSEASRTVLSAIASLTTGEPRVRQSALVDALEASGTPFNQGYVSQLADGLVDGKWVVKHAPNQRTTFYSLGGRGRIIKDVLLSGR